MIINPPAKEILEPYYDRPDFPRTALAFLAGYVRSQSNLFKVDVLDAKFDRLSFEDVQKTIEDNDYSVVALTAMTNEIKSAAKVAENLKRSKPHIITVVGGVHITALPERTMREFRAFDYGVVGEGEDTFLKLLESIHKEKRPTIPGLCFIENEIFIYSGPSIPVPDQDSIKPAWDMFRPAKEYMIQSSRGCPFNCNFCMNPGGRKIRPRTVDTTIKEIEYLVENMQPKSIYFGDEIFTAKINRAKEICRKLIEKGLHKKVQWWCQTHVNTLDEELVILLKQAGCKLVGLGIETGDDEIFKQMGKGINKQKVKKAIALLHKHKLNFDSMFILGQPNETIESAKKTIDFAVELNPATPIFGLMVPYPGTKVGEMALKGEGGYSLITQDWDMFNKQIGNALEMKGIKRKDLEKIQFLGYLKVFIYNFRVWDFFKFCFQYRNEGFQALKKIAFSRS